MAAEERSNQNNQNNQNNAKRGRRRGRRRRSSARGGNKSKRDGLHPEALAAIPTPQRREPSDCPICGKVVRDVHSAIAYGEDDKPAHLECVLKEIGERESIASDERLCYIGAGRFGVIKSKIGKQGLEVVRTIQYEERENAVQWRREASPGLSRASASDPVSSGRHADDDDDEDDGHKSGDSHDNGDDRHNGDPGRGYEHGGA